MLIKPLQNPLLAIDSTLFVYWRDTRGRNWTCGGFWGRRRNSLQSFPGKTFLGDVPSRSWALHWARAAFGWRGEVLRFGGDFWCPMHRLPLSQSKALSPNSLLSQPSSLLGTPGAELGMPQELLHLGANPTAHLASTWAPEPQLPPSPYSQLHQFPHTHGIPAPRTGIPCISEYPSSNKRNSPNLRVSSQTKSKGN